MAAIIPIYGTLRSATVNGALVEDFGVVGGYHAVQTLSERNAIKSTLRVPGMAVYVVEESKLYTLNPDMTTWKEYSSDQKSDSTAIAPSTTVTKNTIDVVKRSISTPFEKSMVVYIEDVTDTYCVVKTFGIVTPSNMPLSVEFGDRIYIKEDRTIVTSLNSEGKYKFVGVVVINDKGNYAISLSNMQTTYKVIPGTSITRL